MSREEMIAAIKAVIGRKLEFPEEYYECGLPEIGEQREVCAVTQKYVYLGTDCLVKEAWSDDDGDYVKVVRRIPVCGTLSYNSVIDSKVELDRLTEKDLKSLMNGIKDFFHFAVHRIDELKRMAAFYEPLANKYEKALKKFG